MASTSIPSSASHPYSYQKPSTLATRTLITGSKPTESASSGSHDHNDTPDTPTLQRNTTTHYQDAIAAAGQQNSTANDDASRPGVQQAQGSYSKNDYKRGVMEQTLASSPTSPQGYFSTAK